MRKFFGLFLSCMLFLNLVPGTFVSAETFGVPAAGKTVIAGKSCSGYNKTFAEIFNGYSGIQWPSANDWASYEINVEEAGSYAIRFYISAPTTNATIDISRISAGGEFSLGKMTRTGTGGWTNYVETDPINISLIQGQQTLKLTNKSGGMYLIYFTLERVGEFVATPIFFEAESFTASSRVVTSLSKASGGRIMVLNSGNSDWIEYDVNVETEGNYVLIANYSTSVVPMLAIYVNDMAVPKTTMLMTTTGTTFGDKFAKKVIGQFSLNSGINKIKIVHTPAGGNGIYLDYFTLEQISRITLSKLVAGGQTVVTGGEVPKSTDTLSLTFTQNVKEDSVTSSTISFTQNGQEVPAEFSVKDNIVTMALKKALSPNNNCVLTINGVSDGYELYRVELANYPFSVSNEGTGKSFVSITSSSIEDKDVSISGVMQSSVKVGIEGRRVDLFMTAPNESVKNLVASKDSGVNGIYNITYSLPADSVSGVYKFEVGGEYVTDVKQVDFDYVSPETLSEMNEMFRLAKSWSDVKVIFDTYATMLGLTPTADMANIPSPEKVYEHFIGSSFNIVGDLKADYRRYIALETINYAATASVVKNVLSSVANCGLLKLNTKRIVLIQNNIDNLCGEILALPEIRDIDEFAGACGTIIEKWLAAEYGISDAISTAADKTVLVGQGIDINLGFAQKVDSITKAVFELECDNESLFSGVRAQLTVDGTVDVTQNGNKAVVTITFKKPQNNITDIGRVTLTATGEGENSVKISGKTEISVKEKGTDNVISVYGSIMPKNITVTIQKDTGKKGGSTGTSRSDTGGGAVYIPPVVEVPDTPKESFKFSDLDTVAWAADSIYALLEKGIVTEGPDKLFKPLDNIKREEFVKLVVLALNLYDKNAQTELTDIPSDAWYYSYVASAEKSGLIKGSDDGRFGTSENITREDMAVIIYRALEKLKITIEPGNDKFTDDDTISNYAKDGVYAMRAMQIINGMGDNEFAPKDNVTRAMAAKVISGMIKAVK